MTNRLDHQYVNKKHRQTYSFCFKHDILPDDPRTYYNYNMMVTIQRQRNILVHFAFWILIKFSQNWKRLLFQTALCGSRSITHRNEWHRLGSSPCIHCRHPPPPPTAPHHSLAKFINFMKIIQRAVELFSVSSCVHFQLKTRTIRSSGDQDFRVPATWTKHSAMKAQ